MWLAIVACFSPVLVDIAREGEHLPYGWSVCLALALLARIVLTRPQPESSASRVGLGMGCIAAGATLEVIGILGGAWTVARVGLPLALLGAALRMGRPPAAWIALAFWFVPIPATVYQLTTPVWESIVAQLAAGLVAPFGWVRETVGPLIRLPGTVLEVMPRNSGIHLAWLGSLLGWYWACLAAPALSRAHFSRALGGAVTGALLQIPVVAASVAVAAGASPGAARSLLDDWAWPVLAGVALVAIELAQARGRGRAAG